MHHRRPTSTNTRVRAVAVVSLGGAAAALAVAPAIAGASDAPPTSPSATPAAVHLHARAAAESTTTIDEPTLTTSTVSEPTVVQTTPVEDPVTPDFGYQKIRIGVQIDPSVTPPAGATTAGTTVTYVETDQQGRQVNSGSCTTGTEEDGTTTYCPDDVYPQPGDTVTVHQQTVNAGLTRSADQTVGPCVDDDEPVLARRVAARRQDESDYPTCQGDEEAVDVILTDGVPTRAAPAPVAADDTATTPQNDPVTIDVLANDTYSGQPGVLIQTEPDHGSAAVVDASDGAQPAHRRRHAAASSPAPVKVVYTPAAGFSGVDTFTYRLITGNGSSVASVTVTVTPPATVTSVPVLPSTTAPAPSTSAPVTVPVVTGTPTTSTSVTPSFGTLPTATHVVTSDDVTPPVVTSSAPNDPVAVTGEDVAGIGGAGVLLVVGGAALAAGARRRRGRHSA